MSTTFESLCNDVLMIIFEYIGEVELLLDVFLNLNQRLNSVLFDHRLRTFWLIVDSASSAEKRDLHCLKQHLRSLWLIQKNWSPSLFITTVRLPSLCHLVIDGLSFDSVKLLFAKAEDHYPNLKYLVVNNAGE